MTASNYRTSESRPSAREILGVVTNFGTYKRLLYLVLAFPLGLLYFSILLVGFTLGLVFAVVIVGIGILLATIGGARVIAHLERWLANRLLGTDIEEPTDLRAGDGLLAKSRALVDARSTWWALGFSWLKFWVGIVGLVLLAFLINAIQLLTAPVRYPVEIEFGTVNDDPVAWTIDTLPEAALAVPVALAAILVLLHVTNGVGYVAARMAESMLGENGSAPDQSETTPTDERPESEGASRQAGATPTGEEPASVSTTEQQAEPPAEDGRAGALSDRPSAPTGPSEHSRTADPDADGDS